MLETHDLEDGEFAARVQWAKRQGNPAWLWPDVRVADWRTALRAIEEVVRLRLSGVRSFRPLDGDALAIGLACYTSGIGPLLGWWLEEGQIGAPPAVGAVLAFHLQHNRQRAERMASVARDIAHRFSRHDLPVLVLKGAHTAIDYFPDPATRPASDIDLLIPPGHEKTADDILESAGFHRTRRAKRESSWRLKSVGTTPRSLMFVHADDPWSVDLHSSLDHVVASGAPIARLDAIRPFDRCDSWGPNPRAGILGQPKLLLHLAIHAGAGLHNLTLLRMVELQMVIAQDLTSGRLSWQEFLAVAHRADLLGFAFPALHFCEKLVPGTIPPSVLGQCAVAAPEGVRKLVAPLQPAEAQRIGRSSIAEHFMWSSGWRDRAWQVGHDLCMPSESWKTSWGIYEARLWQLIRSVNR